MALQWNGEQAKRDVEEEVGAVLLRNAVLTQTAFMARISTPNPPPHAAPSRPGEYLKLRTGHARAGVFYDPKSPREAGRQGYVIVGHTAPTWYAPWWSAPENARRRKGLVDLIEELRGQLGGP